MTLPGATPITGNLGAELTSFVGRRREVTEVSRLISLSRLVTLTGVGGVGKTRLALRVGTDRRRDFRDGVWFVDLAPLEDEGLVTDTVASALGLQDQGTAWPVSALAAFLQPKELLLILDNCEHLSDSCAVLVDALLRQAPGLRVVATSRHSLGVTGEHIFPVPPLNVPADTTTLSVDSVLHYEAVNLFVDRARAVRPTFALTDDNVIAVTAICHRLDGIPLALELAAARMSAMSVRDLLERLEDRFQLLTSGSTAALPRHQTLRELIDWSWELCSSEERALWARTSIFPSEFDLPAVEVICAGGAVDGPSILDALTGLVQKTIVMVLEHEGGVRYRMLETLRQYGRMKLELEGEEDELRERHRAHYRRLAGVAREEWFGVRQKHWLDWFRCEHSNVRLALDTSFDQPALVDSGLAMVADLWVFWFATGRTSEARHWLDRGLRSPAASTQARTGALARSAYLSVIQHDIGAAKTIVAELENARAEDWGPSDAGWSVAYVLALAAMSEGELARAERFLDEAYAADASNADVQWVQDIRFCMAIVKALLGKLDAAEAICLESIQTSDSHGESSSKCYMLWCLGFTVWQRGQGGEAAARTREALELGQHLGDEPFVVASCFELLAWIAAEAGDPETSARLVGAAQTIWSRAGAFFLTVGQLTQHHDECLSSLREELGEEQLALAMTAGAALPLDQAVAEALGQAWDKLSPEVGVPGNLGPLTKRESEVAGLVAQGLTNKEIAARLVIAQRTAEAHVERILNKLGFNSRAQIAAWVAEQGRAVTG